MAEYRTGRVRCVVLTAAFWCVITGGAGAGDVSHATIWELPLGATMAAMPDEAGFQNYACGSAGGPPRQRLEGWSGFMQCEAEPGGLREVYFEYDDELEYLARAHEVPAEAWGLGTSQDYFPIVTSALFDSDGVLQGLRIVTDPRPDEEKEKFLALRPRQEHYLLGLYLAKEFGISLAKDCRDLPPGDGESPVIGEFVKRNCLKLDPTSGRRYLMQQRYLRKPGQADVDPATGFLTQGEFESVTRFEIYLEPER